MAYEVSKRAGGHRLVFGTSALRASGRVSRVTSPFVPPPDVPVAALERALCESGTILAGEVRVFGRQVLLGNPPRWHSTFDADADADAAWPGGPWWTVDIRSDARAGDVKWTWEVGRHRHLVILARAARLERQPEVLDCLTAHLRSWLEQNPLEQGVHWYSNLEIALRSIAWLQVLGLVGDVLDEDVRVGMARTLHHAGTHLLADLPYTLSSMRNNHLLGDALGLVVLGSAFPGDPAARRWRRIGDHLFASQATRMVRPDGSMTEDSLSYHRFVLEMLATRVLLGDAPATMVGHIAAAAQHLARLGALDGPVPQHGDWDEGRVLVGGDPADLAGSIRLALALAGSGAPAEWRSGHDEVAWYAAEGEPLQPDPPETAGRDVGGGLGRARAGPFTVWLKAGSGPSHGHADLCSSPIAFGGRWVVGDPGTGSYNGRPEQRLYFRSSMAHSVLRLEGADQLVPHRSFRWLHQAHGQLGPPLRWPGGVVMWGWHDAYRRLQPPRRVARTVVVDGDGVTVADWVEGGPGTAFELSLPLGPGCRWADGRLALPGGQAPVLDLPSPPLVAVGGDDPHVGWWSSTYGAEEPAELLRVNGVVAGPVSWSLWAPGAEHSIGFSGGALRRGPLELAVEFEPSLVTLRLAGVGPETVALSRDDR